MKGEQEQDESVDQKRGEYGAGRIWKLGNRWWVQYYINGKQVRESSGSSTKAVAQKLLDRRLGKKMEDGDELLQALKIKKLRYEDLRAAYFDEYVTLKRKSLRFDKAGKPKLDKVKRLDNFFAGYRIGIITTDKMREFSKQLQERGKKDSTINRSLAALRHMFRLAKKEGKLRDVPYFPMLKEPPARKGLLGHEKYPLLLAALPEYLRLMLVIGYHTGMRLGEIRKLKWEQVYFLDRIIRLNAGETKNDEAREIPIVEELFTMLRQQHTKRRLECPFVCFRFDRDDKVLPIGDFRKVWYARCVKLELGRMEKQEDGSVKYAGLIFHDLRRTFVTDAEEAGAPRHEIMRVTGHKTEAVYRRYAIENRGRQKVAVNKIEAYRTERRAADKHNLGQMEPLDSRGPQPIN
jgi:integrase